MLGKQAKALSPNQIKAVLLHLASTRNPERNRVAFLLSVKAGLRAKEVAILGPVLQKGVPRFSDLKKVQARREFPTKVIQAFQVAAQNRLLAPTLATMETPKPPGFIKLLNNWPWLRQFPARFIGMGVRPEHVRLERK